MSKTDETTVQSQWSQTVAKSAALGRVRRTGKLPRKVPVAYQLENISIQSEYPTGCPRFPTTAYFRDRKRRIDFVFTHKIDKATDTNTTSNLTSSHDLKRLSSPVRRSANQHARSQFESLLRNAGLELERERDSSGTTEYLLVHAPFNVLGRQAELERLQMPVKLSDLEPKPLGVSTQLMMPLFSYVRNPFRLPDHLAFPRVEVFTDAFVRSRLGDFLCYNEDTFFTPQQRVYLTWAIIKNLRLSVLVYKNGKLVEDQFEPDDFDSEVRSTSTFAGLINKLRRTKRDTRQKTIGIKYMIAQGIFTSGFPLHDSDCNPEAYKHIPTDEWPLRAYLSATWANWRMWHKYQPLEQIRDYYGEQVGMYFAWLGFYTHTLILPSVAGVGVFIGSLISIKTSDANKYLCENQGDYQLIFCRQCAREYCPFSESNEKCSEGILTRVVDNFGTTIFSMVMSLWTVVFLELWKRYQSELCTRWDVSEHEYHDEQVRPEYNLNAPTVRIDPITHKLSPHLPTRSRYQRLIASVSTVLFFVSIVIAFLFAVIIYKNVASVVWFEWLSKSRTRAPPVSPTLVTSITASLLNGVAIFVMTKVYRVVATRLTHLEMPRTEQEFQMSFTYKMFIFQFVNYYGALFYLAFIRGQYVPSPLVDSHVLQCPPTGCLLDVSIQLLIIMTGKQLMTNIVELGVPLMNKLIRNCKRKMSKQKVADDTTQGRARWEKDTDLSEATHFQLFNNYLAMTIQFGFVTMFVAAFPLAPLLALVNNIVRIRLDAYKMLGQTQRFIPIRAQDIGAWFDLLSTLSKIAVLTNALLIAVTSTFLETVVHQQEYSHIDAPEFLLTPFNTSNWCNTQRFADVHNCTHLRLYNARALVYNNNNNNNNNNTSKVLGTKTRNNNALANGSSGSYATVDFSKGSFGFYFLYNVNEPNLLVEVCYNREYRDQTNYYHKSEAYYHILMARLAFVIVFEHAVLLIQLALEYLIPDVPDHVTIRQERETFLQREWFKRREQRSKGHQHHTKHDDDDYWITDGSGSQSEPESQDWNFELHRFASKLPPQVALRRQMEQEEHRTQTELPPIVKSPAAKTVLSAQW